MADARHELIPLSAESRWRAAIGDVEHAHAHTWGFGRAVALTTGQPTFLYSYEHGATRVVCVLAERRFDGEVDVYSPYGFGGFCKQGPWGEFPARWTAFAESKDWICGYIALNPLLTDGSVFPVAELHEHTHLYVLDLRRSPDELWTRMSSSRRRQLRDWPQMRSRLITDHASLRAFLVNEYDRFLQRRGVQATHRFSHLTLEAIAELDTVLLVGAGSAGTVEAVAVFGRGASSADYLLGVSVPGGERLAAQLIWAGLEWARSLGLDWLNLGGGIVPEDGVAEFKRRFGADVVALRSLRQIYRADRYDALVRERQATTAADRAYFPSYRSPGLT